MINFQSVDLKKERKKEKAVQKQTFLKLFLVQFQLIKKS